MIGGILGAITGLIGAGLQASAQAAQINLGYAQLNEAKASRREQKRVATAARNDQYGNRTSYDDVANEWKIALTPMQGKITKAGELEQMLQLTEDAPEARKQRRALAKRAKEAKPRYEEAVAAYEFREPKSEGAIRDELTNLMATNEMARSKQNQSTLARQALRLGRGQDIPKLIKATDDQLGQGMSETALKARQGAIEERNSRVTAHQNQYLPEIQMWAKLMEGGGMTPEIPTQAGRDLQSSQGQMASALQQALAAGQGAVGSAYGNLASAVGKSPDLSGIAKILASINAPANVYGRGGGTSIHYRDDERNNQSGGVAF
jgi:hypothetical protein